MGSKAGTHYLGTSMGPLGGRCRGIIALYPAHPPGNTGPRCPQNSEFPVPGKKEAKLGWPGDSAVGGTSAWEVRSDPSEAPRVPLGGARRQEAVHPLTITCPSQLPTELLHNQVLKKQTAWVGPPGRNPSGLGSCPGLRDLECWSRQLLTIPVTLGKGPGCRGQGPELVHLHVTQVPGLACVPGLCRMCHAARVPASCAVQLL